MDVAGTVVSKKEEMEIRSGRGGLGGEGRENQEEGNGNKLWMVPENEIQSNGSVVKLRTRKMDRLP